MHSFQAMEERGTRRVLLDALIRPRLMTGEAKHQLYVLQTLLLNLLDERMRSPVQSQDQKALEKIKEMRKLAFDGVVLPAAGGGGGRHQRYGQEYKKLGFVNEVDPTQDFRDRTPPGSLALDLMYSFAVRYTSDYAKLVLDRGDFPFARTSIGVCQLLCSALGVGAPPLESGGILLPMFFAHENPLEVAIENHVFFFPIYGYTPFTGTVLHYDTARG